MISAPKLYHMLHPLVKPDELVGVFHFGDESAQALVIARSVLSGAAGFAAESKDATKQSPTRLRLLRHRRAAPRDTCTALRALQCRCDKLPPN